MSAAKQPRQTIGVDLGGTKIEAVVLDAETLAVLYRERIATEAEQGYEHLLSRVVQVVDACRATAPAAPAVGVGTPGAISTRTGRMKNSNTLCLNDRPLQADLQQRIGLPVYLENDANLFALAESTIGAGRGAALVFGVIMGTGVGGGLVHHGELLRGPQNLAGEWGHHCLNPAGPLCYCGQYGCVETFIAGPAVEKSYATLAGHHLSMAEIVTAARQGAAIATQVMQRFVADFGRAIANVIAILDPDIIVLGGGLSNIDELYIQGRAEVARYIFNDELRTPIVRNKLGDSAGVIGAALLGPRP